MTTPKVKLFLVEDEALIAQFIQLTLEQFGYEVMYVAYSGEEALLQLPKYSPDMVLMDINMGAGINGIDTARKIAEFSAVPIIYLSAYTSGAVHEAARQTKPYAFLTKPLMGRELCNTLELVVERRRVELRLQACELEIQDLKQALAVAKTEGH